MRLGIESPYHEYLSSYLENDQVVPDIGLEYVMKSAGLIEQMGLRRLKPAKRDRDKCRRLYERLPQGRGWPHSDRLLFRSLLNLV
jgi:hypothetical protein